MLLALPVSRHEGAQIHKCQGLTLDLARVSLRSMFAEGQAYVALSRARCLEGLQVLEYSQNCVKARAQLRASNRACWWRFARAMCAFKDSRSYSPRPRFLVTVVAGECLQTT